MQTKSLIKNLGAAFAAQGISFLASVVMSLLVPKILGVVEYGYWQLFIFYTNYVGFFHFGLNDGVYLLNGGVPRGQINKSSIHSQLLFGLTYQVIIAVGFSVVSILFVKDPNRLFVLFATALFLIIYNVTYYYGYVFQAMNETRYFSMSVALDRGIFLGLLLILVFLHVTVFEPYVIAFAVAKLCALSYCLFRGRDFIFSGVQPITSTVRQSIASIKVGFSLMLANIADMLILGIARFMVDAMWGVEVFGKVSFSLSLVSFFIAFVSQASMVLFPALRQGGDEERRSFYCNIRDFMEVCFPIIYIAYFPGVSLLELWLPDYVDSFRYFALLIPICVFNTKMDICSTTYFKVLRLEGVLLKANVATVVASLICTLVGIFVFSSLDAVLIGVVCCIVLRSLWSEQYLNKLLKVKSSALAAEETVLSFMFVVIALTCNMLVGFIIYTLLYALYFAVNHKIAINLLTRSVRLLRKNNSHIV